MSNKVTIYTDGASRGNPGPAAAGYVINGVPYGKKLGVQTNNYAEYTAIILGLEKVLEERGKEKAGETSVAMFMDSQLAVKQLNGEYKVKHPAIKPLYSRVVELARGFKDVSYEHVRREENKEADQAANDALDG